MQSLARWHQKVEGLHPLHGRGGTQCCPSRLLHPTRGFSSMKTTRLSRSTTVQAVPCNLVPAMGGYASCSMSTPDRHDSLPMQQARHLLPRQHGRHHRHVSKSATTCHGSMSATTCHGRLPMHARRTNISSRAPLVSSRSKRCLAVGARWLSGNCSNSNSRVSSVAGGGGGAAGGAPGGGPLADALADMAKQLQALAEEQARAERAAQEAGSAGAVSVRNLSFHPPGCEAPLIKDVSMEVPPNSLGLIIGRSGSGKTTLLQVLAGLCEQTSGDVSIVPSSFPNPAAAPPLSLEARMAKVGLVFQFPERHFLGSDIFSELTFSWPRDPAFFMQQQILRTRVEKVLRAVRLEGVPMARSPWALSGGQQRRLALAIQLVRQPALLLLDEPLAGLDWEARMEVVELLQRLKEECTLLVVSHDLKEVAPLVDNAWSMKLGGTLEPVQWPPP